MPRTRKKEDPPAPYRSCDAEGCTLHADYRAPKERSSNTGYHWFCLDHVRDYNKAWDWFDGMDTEEIEHFRKEAVTGHRPTWTLGSAGIGPEKLRAAFDRFMEHDALHEKTSAPPIDPKDRKALKALELEHPSDRGVIKRQFKRLAKSLHPDVNPGDRAAEDRFKEVTEAYRVLMSGYAETIGVKHTG